MIKQFAHFLAKNNKVAALEIIQFSPDQYLYHVAILTKRNKSFTISLTKENIINISDATSLLKGLPVVICYSGFNVLFKCIESTFKLSESLGKIKEEEFVISSVQIDQFSLNWLVRRNTIEKMLEELSKKEIVVVDISIGSSEAINLFSKENNLNTQLSFGYHKLSYQNAYRYELILPNNPSNDKNKIALGGENINEHCYLAASAVLSYQLKITNTNHHINQLTINRENLLYQIAFKKLGWFYLIFILCALLVNTGWYLHIKSNEEKLLYQSSLLSKELTLKNQLKDTISSRLKLVQETGWMNKHKASQVLDLLGFHVPKNLMLTKLNFNPLKKKSDVGDASLEFEQNKVIIEGIANNPLDLNRYNQAILSLEWVNSSKIVQYRTDQLTGNSKFTIEVILKSVNLNES